MIDVKILVAALSCLIGHVVPVALEGGIANVSFSVRDGPPPDEENWRRFGAIKYAYLLRETMWSMVVEINSALGFDFDFAAWTKENLDRFERTCT